MNKGIIKISPSFTKEFVLMALIFQRFNVLKMDFDYIYGVNYFLMESEEFESVQEGQPIPEFEITFMEQVPGLARIHEVKKIEPLPFDITKYIKRINDNV